MLHALTWFLALGLILAWSLAAWAFHTVATLAATQSGALAGGIEGIRALPMPDWLAPWVSAEWWPVVLGSLAELGPFLDGLLAVLPTLSGPLSILVWVIWAVGAFAIVVLGGVVSGLIAHAQARRSPHTSVVGAAGSRLPAR